MKTGPYSNQMPVRKIRFLIDIGRRTPDGSFVY
jgi:hypothetical protein